MFVHVCICMYVYVKQIEKYPDARMEFVASFVYVCLCTNVHMNIYIPRMVGLMMDGWMHGWTLAGWMDGCPPPPPGEKRPNQMGGVGASVLDPFKPDPKPLGRDRFFDARIRTQISRFT